MLRIVLIAFVALFLAEFVPAPWAFHIGSRFTPLGQWDGYGPVQASDGGRYLLFTHLQGGVFAHGGRPGCFLHGGCNNLRGSAKLCTESGRVYSFSLTGTMHGWLTTDGSPTDISLSGGSLAPLPPGLVVAFHGIWHGPVLPVASTDGSFTEAFTPAGAIRKATSAGARRHRERHPAQRLGHGLRPGLPRAGDQPAGAAAGSDAAAGSWRGRLLRPLGDGEDLRLPRAHGEASCPAHWATVDTSACRGNTFSVRTRCTSGSASRQASARTVSP